jgi:hypothetical protein
MRNHGVAKQQHGTSVLAQHRTTAATAVAAATAAFYAPPSRQCCGVCHISSHQILQHGMEVEGTVSSHLHIGGRVVVPHRCCAPATNQVAFPLSQGVRGAAG